MKKRLLTHLSRAPRTGFSRKELNRAMRLRTSAEARELSALLGQLELEGVITVDKQKRYSYQPSATKSRSLPGREGRIVGRLRVMRRGAGVVVAEGTGEEIRIPAGGLHTALHGDRVAVIPFAGNFRGRKRGEPEVQEGEVAEIIERANMTVVGTLERSGHFFFVVPDDERLRRDIYVTHEEASRARLGDKVVVRPDPWEDEHQNPEGSIIEVLGPGGNPHAEILSVARSFSLPVRFPDEVVKETGRLPLSPGDGDIQGRADLRKIPCFTIDPADAKDFDDALSVERLGNGLVRLGVHIADVSYYVREGSQLDREAFRRGTSIYLVNEVIPMLPERLSNDLCSLKPGVDRLTFSVLLDIDEQAKVKSYRITKSIIHSARRFTYEEAQEIITGRRGDHREDLLLLNGIARSLTAERMARGGLDFETAEVRFEFDASGLPARIVKKERLDAHRLVEECMLLANQTVARHIGAPRDGAAVRPFIYRIHDSPDPERLRDLASFVKKFGFPLDARQGVSSKALQRLLKRVKGSEAEFLINDVALRSMAKAVYAEKNIGHYGLALPFYTHFTSPIRRYPDLIVHRLLEEYNGRMQGSRLKELSERVPVICRQSSACERTALEAERASVKVMQVEYMKRHVGDVLDGIIGGVTNFGLFVEINDLVIEGLVRMRDLGDDYYIFDEKEYALRGRSRGKIYRLGDRVKVQVVSVDPREHQIDMIIVK